MLCLQWMIILLNEQNTTAENKTIKGQSSRANYNIVS